MTKLSLIAGLMAATTLPAGAATLSIDGGMDGTLPSNNDVSGGQSEITIFNTTTADADNDGMLEGGLKLDGPATLTFEYLGSEAAHDNVAFTSSIGNQTLFSNDGSANVGDTISIADADGGFVDLGFSTSPGGTIANNGAATSAALDLVFSDVFDNGQQTIAYFGDGTGDDDYDDLVVGVTASPVPVPAAAPLLIGALGGLGFAGRRWKRRA